MGRMKELAIDQQNNKAQCLADSTLRLCTQVEQLLQVAQPEHLAQGVRYALAAAKAEARGILKSLGK